MVARLPNELDATHNLLLNKYPVIPRHSIVSTIGFKRQTDFLDSQDLDVTYSCLQAWEGQSTEESPSRLFAFFNSGEHSGASQPHRHLQLLPVEDMMDSGSRDTGWQPLIDVMTERLPAHPGIFSDPSLPFCHYAMRIPTNPGTGLLQQIYRSLYDRASTSAWACNERGPIGHTAVGIHNGEASLSYNLAMTTHAMAICPRRKETATIPTSGDEGSAAINGTILGGTLMVKEKSEWEAFRQGYVVIDDVLAEIGVPCLNKSEDTLNTRL